MSPHEEQIDSHHGRSAHHGIGKHVDDDMRSEPRTLKGGHERLGMNLRFEQIDADEDQSQDCGKSKNPLVSPPGINDDARERQEEGIPQPRLTHGAERWPFQRNPHPNDEGEENEQSGDGHPVCHAWFVFPRCECTGSPRQDGNDRKIDEIIPTHACSLLTPSKNIDTAPSSIIPIPV